MCAKTYEVYDKLNPPIEEAFKTLRTNIQFCVFEKKIKTLTIVSCNHKEGKTSVSINLAISIARSGTKVLLVDADLRKPTLIKRLGGRDPIGLSSYLKGEESLEKVISFTSIKNLFYISCGPRQPNPSELIGSTAFTEFLREVEKDFDMVIIDTSTLGSVIDGAIVASQTDGTLVVVASREVETTKAKRLKAQLETVNAKVLGVVLNKVSKRDYKMYNGKADDFYFYTDVGVVRKFDRGRFRKLRKKEVAHDD